jgi:hypothetical protein
MMEQVAEDERGQKAMEWMGTTDDKDQQSTIDRSAKAGGNTAVKADAAPAEDGAFRRCVDHVN